MSTQKILELKKRIQFRDQEFDLLNAFLSPNHEECAPVVFVHGYNSVGKTLSVFSFLDTIGVKKTVIQCDEVVNNRLLLQKCLKLIRTDSGQDLRKSNTFYDRGGYSAKLTGCDSFSSFAFNLQMFIDQTGYNDPHFLVLDRIDSFIDEPINIVNSFIRMRDCTNIKNIIVIFISRTEIPNPAVTSAIPQVYFKPYTDQQLVSILQKNQFCFFGDEELDNSVVGTQFWHSYVQVIVDSYHEYCGTSISMLIDFIRTVKTRQISPSEFMKVYREQRTIFQDDSILNAAVIDYRTDELEQAGTKVSLSDFTYLAKFILIASYLASHIDPRLDMYYFTSAKYSKFVYSSKKGNEITKRDIDVKLLQPNFFDLERLYGILTVIYRNESASFNKDENSPEFADKTEVYISERSHEIAKFSLVSNIDLPSQMASLLSRGLIVRQFSRDILQPKTRWKSNLSWEEISSISKDIGFPIHNYLK
ncbi:hypothetical protein CANTEDRAFT_98870 [Yamadazyma tenuis ATCC 10573]|uniref:Orc1-like AAA ATPase domain-containing protein n=1 Tax=Candida tenuis (strain ATCC 10573 / BCRC 21748 / CBS 615 / JCM 9827 / NBRC 10315 / NRRL Y-1498 / VKM Y-70) TaxID=590646 RepID=G3B804_CANTC|nr:uncharacterized protein CANTEDRAFT_98870 [Yamadazyma tenuis ATCC 10573]EGV61699.1 hypothetical protein CANTEDRAFT_98870 [Yamadazyma tenuis ATCC 10573]